MVSWGAAVGVMDLKRMYEALDLTVAICGNYGEGFGARVCVGPLLLKLGEKKVKKSAENKVEMKDGTPVVVKVAGSPKLQNP